MRPFFWAFLMLCSQIVWAQMEIKTIQVNHRLAIEVLPEIQAFLPDNATARAFNDFIIVKAEPTTLTQITALIRQLDTPPQRLKVTVLKSYQRIHDVEQQALSAQVDVRDQDLSGHVAIERWSTQDTQNDEQFYQAQGLANRAIYIDMGEAIPQTEHYLILRHDGDLAVESQTEYLQLNSGFKAVAHIMPNHQVMIDIHPRFDRLTGTGTIQHSQVITRLSGPANTWIELGQISQKKQIEKQGHTHYSSHREQQQYLYIKVEQL